MAVRCLCACGSGIATSAYAAQEIQRIAKEIGVQVEIHKDRITNVYQVGAQDYDVLFVSSNFKKDDIGCPVVKVDGIISGIGEDEAIEAIKQALIAANNK